MKRRLVTHNGSFHTDDLFACATLSLYLQKKGEDFEIIRSRDPDVIKNGDYVFDVGGEYSVEKNIFDHHQSGGAGKRENGIEYASFGLVWKHFGLELCGGNEEVWQELDREIASPIDAEDNGQDVFTETNFKDVSPYSGARVFRIFSPTWQEKDKSIDDIFRQEVKNVTRVLRREIETAKADDLGRNLILESYEKAKDKRIVELDHNFPRYLYQNTLSRLPEPIYLIYKSSHSETWKVEAVTKGPETKESRKPFPEEWRVGVMNNPKLPEITGVPDVNFCHRNGFLANTLSREGAWKLAETSLNFKEKKSKSIFKFFK